MPQPFNPAHEVQDRIQAATQQPDASDRLLNQANDLMRAYNMNGSNASSEILSRQMAQSGVLPDLLIQERGRLNVDGQGDISRRDLQTITEAQPGTYRPTTVLAARYALQNFDRINRDVTMSLFGSSEQELTQRELEAFSRNPERQNRPQGDVSRTPEALRQQLSDVLVSREGNPQSKFSALETLHGMGVRNITLRDANGQDVNCRIDVRQLPGGRTVIGLFAQEGNRERVVLRAIGNNGQYEQQRDSQGRQVGFTGDWWTRNRQESNIGLGQTREGSQPGRNLPERQVADPQPPRSPRPAPLPPPAPQRTSEVPRPEPRWQGRPNEPYVSPFTDQTTGMPYGA